MLRFIEQQVDVVFKSVMAAFLYSRAIWILLLSILPILGSTSFAKAQAQSDERKTQKQTEEIFNRLEEVVGSGESHGLMCRDVLGENADATRKLYSSGYRAGYSHATIALQGVIFDILANAESDTAIEQELSQAFWAIPHVINFASIDANVFSDELLATCRQNPDQWLSESMNTAVDIIIYRLQEIE